MADNEKKPVIAHMPAILTGSAALLAALTTVYVNVRNDLKGEPEIPPAISTPAAPLPVAPVLPAAPQELQLRLQRIAITIKGWRGGWLKKSDAPRVSGEGWLTNEGALAPISVTAEDGKQGAFTFYFSAIPLKD